MGKRLEKKLQKGSVNDNNNLTWSQVQHVLVAIDNNKNYGFDMQDHVKLFNPSPPSAT